MSNGWLFSPGTKVECVDRGEFEGGRVRVEPGDDGGQELSLPRLGELQHGRQDRLRAPAPTAHTRTHPKPHTQSS